MLRNIKIGVRLMMWFTLVASIAVSAVSYMAFYKGRTSLEQESFNRLTAIREMKASQIEHYFEVIHDQVQTFSADPTIIRAMNEFRLASDILDFDLAFAPEQVDSARDRLAEYYETVYLPALNPNVVNPVSLEDVLPTDPKSLLLQAIYIADNPYEAGSKHYLDSASDGSLYTQIHQAYHPFICDFQEKFGYYDIFLVDHQTGNIVYSVFKEVDFGTSLIDGPFAKTNLADVFRAAQDGVSKDFVRLVDYSPYHPSYNQPASFIASPIYDDDEQIGVLVFQMPIDRIDNIMTSNQNWKNVGLGESGETYIVGQDFTLRNQSRFLIEDSTNYFKMITSIGEDPSIIKRIRTYQSTIGLQEVRTVGTEDALAGNTDAKIFEDYRGVPVLSSYKPLTIEGMDGHPWVIMSEIDEEEAFAPISDLRGAMIGIVSGLFILILLVSWFISRRIAKPLKHLSGGAKQLAKGNMDAVINIEGKDEIGVLASSFRKMQASIKNLISELKDINANLENKVAERTFELQKQKDLIQEKNQEIVDSITYAKRIQSAILPPDDLVEASFKESFILYKPKDIVAGDFYWLEQKENKIIFAAADCTGHGVPGAMVSVLCNNALHRSLREFDLDDPAKILDKTREIIIEDFERSSEEVKDGMDIALCSLEGNKLSYAGAHNPLWIIRKGADDIEEIKANKQPIGKFDNLQPYTTHHVELKEGDSFFIFSDGFSDQFGGENGKKMKSKNFKRLLLSLKDESMLRQKELIDEAFESWKGQFEQLDDVCVIGVRV